MLRRYAKYLATSIRVVSAQINVIKSSDTPSRETYEVHAFQAAGAPVWGGVG